MEAAACSYALASCVAGGLLMAPWVGYNLTRFEHPVFLSNGVGSVLMVANCDSTVPAGRADAGAYRGTFHGTYVGYWSIFCTGGLDAKLDQFYPPEARRVPQGAARRHPRHRHQLLRRRVDARGRVARGRYRRDQGPPQPDAVDGRAPRRADVGPLPAPPEHPAQRPARRPRRAGSRGSRPYEYFPLLGLSIVGLVLLRRRKVPILPFLAIAATITITAATSFGITRYRAPVDAMLPGARRRRARVGVRAGARVRRRARPRRPAVAS